LAAVRKDSDPALKKKPGLFKGVVIRGRKGRSKLVTYKGGLKNFTVNERHGGLATGFGREKN